MAGMLPFQMAVRYLWVLLVLALQKMVLIRGSLKESNFLEIK
jgi:hypothetical protein